MDMIQTKNGGRMSSPVNIRNVDLHVHTSERSPCAINSEEEQIRAAIAAGLDAIFITDHHRLIPVERLEALNRTFAPFRVFSGIEFTSQGEDFVILGLRDPRMESSNWLYPDLHAFVRAQGGFMVLAHPFRYREQINVDVEQFPTDAIEVHSPNTPIAAEDRIRDLANRLQVSVLCNSDAHSSERLGQYYNSLNHPIFTEQELFAALKGGQFALQKNVPIRE
jgi:histidinol phosphatase-like PHP family hydrolase